MSQHTPGPWSTDGKWSESDGGVIIRGGQSLAVGLASYLGGTDQAKINARLIAAAPDLLAALEALVGAVRMADAYNEIRQAETAIAKAKGESSPAG